MGAGGGEDIIFGYISSTEGARLHGQFQTFVTLMAPFKLIKSQKKKAWMGGGGSLKKELGQ